MAEANKILLRMLERLFAGLADGPSLNCRPHSSRQRVDFVQLARLKDLSSEDILNKLLSEERAVKLTARVSPPSKSQQAHGRRSVGGTAEESTPNLSPEERAAHQSWNEQQAILTKLRILADEARTYEQDTGVHVLNIGFPLLSLPPGSISASGGRMLTKRVLAPLAFIPVTLSLRMGTTPTIELACKSDGIERVSPNTALLAWLEQQSGVSSEDLFADETGEEPWREIADLVRHVTGILGIDQKLFRKDGFREGEAPAEPGSAADGIGSAGASPSRYGTLRSSPRAEDSGKQAELIPAAVLGLFPLNNQGLLRDVQAMVNGEALDGPVESFIRAGVSLDAPSDAAYEHDAWSGQKRTRAIDQERLVTHSDPCQTRAVRLARECRGLVIHGPPGTGKSQTITNVIGDHLARGERVLMVCDKRTALDVVADRLEHLGLGSLCALVHDPRRDQNDLYRALRDRLENLTEQKTSARSVKQLDKIDAELTRLHTELTEYWANLTSRDEATDLSFHDAVGRWLGLSVGDAARLDPDILTGATLSEWEQHEQDVRDLLVRAEQAKLPDNPWTAAADVRLEDYLARPLAAWREPLQGCVKAAAAVNATAHAAIPPFAPQPALPEQAKARAELVEPLKRVLELAPASLAHWSQQKPDSIRVARQRLAEAAPFLEVVRAGPLDAELALVTRGDKTSMATIAQQLGTLHNYLEIASRWYGIIFLKRRARAVEVLNRYGLPPGAESAQRLRTFLIALRARAILEQLGRDLLGDCNETVNLSNDDSLLSLHFRLDLLFDLLLSLHSEPALASVSEPVRRALTDPATSSSLLDGLKRSPARAEAIVQLEATLARAGLFGKDWAAELIQHYAAACGLAPQAKERFTALLDQMGTLEIVLRVRREKAKLPPSLLDGVNAILERRVSAETATAALHQAVLAAEIIGRLRAHPELQLLDQQRLESNLQHYRQLEVEKKDVVRDLVLHHWVERQRERLLVSTQSRLNSAGADLRRRLTMRGEKALRLRQVIAVGQEIEGGDPLFDLCPVWLASPQTVGQIFPRLPLFDVVIFDEASQCRLEEALPVLTRARRVVIAGDPKQLPPTRFFESALIVSEEESIESEQQLFEAHQGEIEDLLTAALSIDIQQCYLDVHYRSRNADLIAFSNDQFYSARLQPLPGHPKHRARFAPITLYRANGTYIERKNEAEAVRVCQIVRDLLKRAEPPSIGIACFNLAQRDLIVEKLDELAGEDREFASRLADARSRRGEGSVEGLFVKNLENVQGDERDHIIISTTYGPDAEGRFYRRFGPLGRQGGGRRLNVLITRARQEVHLVTSIPREIYRSLPPIPAGQAPGGGWLLFAYLAFAERLAEAYEKGEGQEARDEEASATCAAPSMHIRPTRAPSPFTEALARQLLAGGIGSEVYWGNDGFCVDLALRHPTEPDDVTIGVLCDGSRFPFAEDAVEWDLFRTTILEALGWKLHRLWTPHFFRDPTAAIEVIRRAAEQEALVK